MGNVRSLWAEVKETSLNGCLRRLKSVIIITISLAIMILLIFGWVNNIVKLTKCDFSPSYKAEVIRTVGIFVAPAGMIMGYIDIEDKSNQQ